MLRHRQKNLLAGLALMLAANGQAQVYSQQIIGHGHVDFSSGGMVSLHTWITGPPESMYGFSEWTKFRDGPDLALLEAKPWQSAFRAGHTNLVFASHWLDVPLPAWLVGLLSLLLLVTGIGLLLNLWQKCRRRPAAWITAILVFLFACVTRPVCATPVDDLASPEQSVRDAAAAYLRTNYVPPARTNWDALLASLRIGDTESNIEARLQWVGPTNIQKLKWDPTTPEDFRLDDVWNLHCEFWNSNNTLVSVKLYPDIRHIWVIPPPHFTGRWTLYHVNGRKFTEAYFQEGKLNGQFVCFNPDGTRYSIYHYNHGIEDGEYVRFYPDGHIQYKCMVIAGRPDGKGIAYNEDGTVHADSH